ncbi:MAG: hypothetical protein KJ709_03335 [Nanoarchaeota archaeon]|nr:hypothetical protein [Nanoarchaeota archaeon]
MATVMDLGLLEFFKPIISIVLVAALAYGLFSYTKIFGDNKGLYALIAIFIALILAIVPALNDLVATMLPWFVVFFIFVVFLLMGYKLFGAKDEDFRKVVTGNRAVVYWMIFIAILILLGSIGKVFFTAAEDIEATGNHSRIQTGEVGGTGEDAFWATIVHPKVLGLIIIMLISVFTVITLAGSKN